VKAMKNTEALSYSVIVPAYNEEKLLPRCLEALKAAMAAVSANGEVIVVDNNSTDRTAEIARNWGAKVVFEPFNQISRARNAGARQASGKWLVFLDADTFLSGELLEIILGKQASGRCCGGGVVIDMDRRLDAINRSLLGLWTWISRRFRLAAGCLVFCPAEGWRSVGGFSEKVYASEEIWFSIALGAWGASRGMRFIIVDKPRILTSGRKTGNTLNILITVLTIMLFPFAIRFRSLSWFWYHRDRD